MAKNTTLKKGAAKKSAPSIKKPAPAPKAKKITKKAVPQPSRPPAESTVKLPVVVIKKEEPKTAVIPSAPEPTPIIESSTPTSLPKTVPLTVSVQTSQGAAANGNTHPASLLVIVTCAGWPVTELDKNHFTLMEHFEVVGQLAPFSNSITSFRNAGTGAYLLQTKPINGAPWKSGHHLGQLLVSTSDDQQGQAGFKLIIR